MNWTVNNNPCTLPAWSKHKVAQAHIFTGYLALIPPYSQMQLPTLEDLTTSAPQITKEHNKQKITLSKSPSSSQATQLLLFSKKKKYQERHWNVYALKVHFTLSEDER